MGGGGTHRDAGGSLELSSQQSFPSCRYDITADVLGSPVSLGMVFLSLWARAPATPPQQMGGMGAPIHQFLEIPLVLASCSINLLVKILPYGANKKRMFIFLFIPKLPEFAALWPRVAGNVGFGLWGPCQC